MNQQQLFKDLRVVDLSTVLAGPSVATFFAELGAHVVKVENRNTGGDVTRSWKLTSEDADNDVSAYFASVNYKKDYLFLDLHSADDRLMVKSLIVGCDILITNFKEGDAEKFGLDYNEVATWNPSIIYGHISGFASSPGRVAYDVVLQAETGFMSMNGTTESGPLKMPVALIDVLAAHQLKEGILCALIARQLDQKGSYVEVSLEKSAISSLVNQASNFLMTGYIPEPAGSLHPNIAPYGETFKCRDNKMLVLAVGSDKQFVKLCNILGAVHLADQAEFSSNTNRVRNREKLSASLNPLFELLDGEALSAQLNQANVPCGIIRNMEEVMKLARQQNMILEEVNHNIPTSRVASVAFTISR